MLIIIVDIENEGKNNFNFRRDLLKWEQNA
jgi:hypothetical protein